MTAQALVLVAAGVGASTANQRRSGTGLAAAGRAQEETAACADAASDDTRIAAIGLTLCTARPVTVDGKEVRTAAVVAANEGGVAERAGLEKGDLLYQVSDEPTPTAQAAAERLDAVDTRSDVVVNFYRGGHPFLVKLRLPTP
jgi:S1-C subfamily serine protease